MSELSRTAAEIPDELTLGEALQFVIAGQAKGYTVLGQDFEISFSFCRINEDLFPESTNDTFVPMSVKEATNMYDDLEMFSPEELEEVAIATEGNDPSLN